MMIAPTSRTRSPQGPDSAVGVDTIRDMVEIAHRAPVGNIVEVGVWRGGAAWFLAGLAIEWGAEIHLFDTFTGMPFSEPGDSHAVGDFGDTSLDQVLRHLPCAHFHVGVFPDTLPDTLVNLSVVHVDCDQYRSVRDCIGHLGPRMVSGGMMFFDDYMLPCAAKAIADCGLTLPPRERSAAPYVTF